MSLSGGDRRPARLSGLDRRVARLLGGDRLAPTPALISGSAALAALAAAGLSSSDLGAASSAELEGLLAVGAGATALSAAGVVNLAELFAVGGSGVALGAPGAGALSQLLGAGSCTVDLPPTGSASLSSLEASGGASAFRPSDIPEVAAGHFWDPAAATGSGSASFLMPEGNGKTAFNQITPSLGAAPTISTVNGVTVIQHTNRVSPSIDSLSRTASALSRGWTGATMVCGWFYMPAGGAGLAFGHWRPSQNLSIAFGNTRIDIGGNSGAGAVANQHTVASGWLNNPFFFEARFVPTAAATNRLQAWLNRVQLTPSLATAMGTSLLDTPSFLSFSGTFVDGSGFNINADFAHGVVCHCNGIPSEADIDRLYNYRRLA